MTDVDQKTEYQAKIAKDAENKLRQSVRMVTGDFCKPDKDIVGLFGVPVYEYTLKNPLFTACSMANLLHVNELKRIQRQSDSMREKSIKAMRFKYKNLESTIRAKIREARIELVKQNKVNPNNILSVRFERLYIIRDQLATTNVLGGYSFFKTGTFTGYVAIGSKSKHVPYYLTNKEIEFLYSAPSFSKPVLTVNGGRDSLKTEQKDFLLSEMSGLVTSAIRQNPSDFYANVREFCYKYLNKELDYQAYRSIDDGAYKYGDFRTQVYSGENFDELDVTDNYVDYILPFVRTLIEYVETK